MSESTDKIIKNKINNIAKHDNNFWDFRKNSKRDYVHNLYSYPAMMVPKMIRELLNIVLVSQEKIDNILDPFCGAGTVLVEGMLKGKDVIGIDINPLSILISKVKTQPLNMDILNKKISNLYTNIDKYINGQETIDDITYFYKINKWFKKEVIYELEVIKQSILKENNILYRRFFWVAFCQTIHLVSNSRNSTYKLHIKNEKDINEFSREPIREFKEVLSNNLEQMNEFMRELDNRDLLEYNTSDIPKYSGSVDIIYGDVRKVLDDEFFRNRIDLMITSPPYGDNHTTITYGQFSVLQLRWLDMKDIFEEKWNDKKLVDTQVEIDNRSLGGKSTKSNYSKYCKVLAESDFLQKIINKIIEKDENKKYKVVSFFNDFNESLEHIQSALKKNSYQIWVTGNRRVAKVKISLDTILKELINKYEVEEIVDLYRTIPHKRIPNKNAPKGQKGNYIKTIKKENILIFRKR